MNIFARILPFIWLGIMIVVLAFGIIIFSYLLILGGIVGLILFLIAYIRDKFFKDKYPPKKIQRSGRTIEHDDHQP